MNLTKNQIYIISAVVIAVIVWFVFFRKKTTKVVAVVTPPAPKDAETGYYGSQWNTPGFGPWGQGIGVNSVADSMKMVRGTPDNSVAGTMVANGSTINENGYNVSNNIAYPRVGESGFGGAANDNWLGY